MFINLATHLHKWRIKPPKGTYYSNTFIMLASPSVCIQIGRYTGTYIHMFVMNDKNRAWGNRIDLGRI